jgi:nucleotide sugar dehydrogenase
MIGIIGYGMVGKAIEFGFPNTTHIISDPIYNDITVSDVCKKNPDAIFVAVPTPSDDSNYSILKEILREISDLEYRGLTVVKSTILPHHLIPYDVIYNPEFLSRATSFDDFVNPPMVIIGGERAEELLSLYNKYSTVNTDKHYITSIEVASMCKYMMNSFYAMKITFMNEMFDVVGDDWDEIVDILSSHPWMGTHHFAVPGPDGERGFGGPCLPKDTKALVDEYDIKILDKVMELNNGYRH